MTTIQSFSEDVILNIFEYIQTVEEVCALSKVCKQWRRIARDESLPVFRKRLDRIVYHKLPDFDRLPRERFSLTLKTFTIFQNIIVGETNTGGLCLYDPQKKETTLLDYKPPFATEHPGEFLTSPEACVYCRSYRDIYQIDPQDKTVKKIPFKPPHGIYELALLKNNLIHWTYPPIDMDCFPNPTRRTVLPFLHIAVFDLKSQSAKEMTYPTTKRPRLYSCGERIIIRVGHGLHTLDADLKEVENGTFWLFEIRKIHLIGKKFLIEGSVFDNERHRPIVTIKDVGDTRNYGEEEFDLPRNSKGNLHPFFIEGLGWRFLRCEGIHWKRAVWSLENGELTRASLLPELLDHP